MTRRPILGLLLAALPAAAPAAAQHADSARTTTVAPGVTHARIQRADGPWVIHVLRVDLARADLAVRQVRAHDRLTSRERVSAMVARRAAGGEQVIAAVNADFFDLATGASENNVVIDGEWWRGIRVTDSPYDTFDNVHAQFALDGNGHPLVDRFAFDGWVRAPRARFPLIALNAMPKGAYEGTALWTPRAGATTPRDTMRATSELSLAPAGRRADTLLYVRRGASTGGGSDIPPDGVVLSAYGARTVALDSTTDGDTLRITLDAAPWPAPSRASSPSLLIGGWPRILHGGLSVAGRAAADEGTISRNAEVRHPRTAVGVTRDRKTLLLVTVDGRSAASVGMTLVELADYMKSLGAWDALNFDGGGSTTMVLGDRVVNTPSDRTGEREVGSALLIVKRGR
ncbi:MAG: phosphodiester glycosidase family protein [Gemmatimonadetes bacterium]|nr:phosphodiester glycosidase family protein [Gemmatimonadota bacterium]